ncbi:MAG: LacI family DNA-binding transcriptional regulator [Bryobacteraceae bacterium]|nr:LacI family DNA-binding transcriptional regulator [Bryobacteraceae bacterium]
MKDVAELSSVSESTVSHVLNNTKFVSPEVRERVLAAMRQLNFHGNAHARRLARGHSDFFGLIVSDIENPFLPGLIKAFDQAAYSIGYDVLLSTTNYEAGRTERSFRKMIENKTPGVAVMTSRIDPGMGQVLEANGVASVFLDCGSIGPLRSNIRLDYAKGTHEAVNFLYNLGHRDFAFIAGPQSRASHQAYLDAIGEALRLLDLQPRLIDGDNDVASGERAVQRLLTSHPLPTVIICSNDLTAIGAIRALLRSGIRVPQDISVVGADDIPFASLCHPPLTTVQIPREKLGTVACEILNRMLKEQQPAFEEVLPTSLVVRESTSTARHTP